MDITSSVFLIERTSSFLPYFNTIKSPHRYIVESKLNFSQSPYSILFWVKVSSTPPKKNPVQRHKRGVDFGKFLLVKPAWNLGRNLHQEKKISDWKPFSSIKMLDLFFSRVIFLFIDSILQNSLLFAHFNVYANWYRSPAPAHRLKVIFIPPMFLF